MQTLLNEMFGSIGMDFVIGIIKKNMCVSGNNMKILGRVGTQVTFFFYFVFSGKKKYFKAF